MIRALEVQLVFLLGQSRSLDVSVHPGKQELDVTSMMVDRYKIQISNVYFDKNKKLIILLNSKL